MFRRLERDARQVTSVHRLNSLIDRLKQPHLIALRRLEQVGAQRKLGLPQAILLRRDLEARLEQVGPRSLPPHSAEEVRIVVAAAAEGSDRGHDLAGAVGIMLVEPRPKERRDLMRQTYRKIEAAGRSRLDRCFDDMLELVIGNLRNDRRDRDVTGDAGVVQSLDRREALLRLWRTRLERPGDFRIQ